MKIKMFTRQKVNRLIVTLAPLCLANIVLVALSKDVYKTIGDDGVTVYSDIAPLKESKVEIVTLDNNNRLPAVSPTMRVRPPDEPKLLLAGIRIVTPKNLEVISMGPGDFTVSVSLVPALSDKEELELMMDDKPLSVQREVDWNLKNVSRGPHQLQVIRKRKSGEIVHKSAKVEILVLRPLPARKSR